MTEDAITRSAWRPMAEFDPSKPAQVHDRLNNEVIDWKPERHRKHYEQYAHPDFDPGVTEWYGLLLDGWRPQPGIDSA